MKQLGHEGGGLVNEISALVKETCLRLPPYKVTKEWYLSMKEASPYQTPSPQYLDPGYPELQICEIEISVAHKPPI